MIATGTGYFTRAIYNQTGPFSVEFNINTSEYKGDVFELGLSGKRLLTPKEFGFRFVQSRIYDPSGKFVGFYDGRPISISFDRDVNDKIQYKINNVPVAREYFNDADFNYLYIKKYHNHDLDVNISLRGSRPELIMANVNAANGITGDLHNFGGETIKIFSFSSPDTLAQNWTYPDEILTLETKGFGQTGDFGFDSGDYLNFNLDTNFGPLSYKIPVTSGLIPTGSGEIGPENYSWFYFSLVSGNNPVTNGSGELLYEIPYRSSQPSMNLGLEYIQGKTGDAYVYSEGDKILSLQGSFTNGNNGYFEGNLYCYDEESVFPVTLDGTTKNVGIKGDYFKKWKGYGIGNASYTYNIPVNNSYPTLYMDTNDINVYMGGKFSDGYAYGNFAILPETFPNDKKTRTVEALVTTKGQSGKYHFTYDSYSVFGSWGVRAEQYESIYGIGFNGEYSGSVPKGMATYFHDGWDSPSIDLVGLHNGKEVRGNMKSVSYNCRAAFAKYVRNVDEGGHHIFNGKVVGVLGVNTNLASIHKTGSLFPDDAQFFYQGEFQQLTRSFMRSDWMYDSNRKDLFPYQDTWIPKFAVTTSPTPFIFDFSGDQQFFFGFLRPGYLPNFYYYEGGVKKGRINKQDLQKILFTGYVTTPFTGWIRDGWARLNLPSPMYGFSLETFVSNEGFLNPPQPHQISYDNEPVYEQWDLNEDSDLIAKKVIRLYNSYGESFGTAQQVLDGYGYVKETTINETYFSHIGGYGVYNGFNKNMTDVWSAQYATSDTGDYSPMGVVSSVKYEANNVPLDSDGTLYVKVQYTGKSYDDLDSSVFNIGKLSAYDGISNRELIIDGGRYNITPNEETLQEVGNYGAAPNSIDGLVLWNDAFAINLADGSQCSSFPTSSQHDRTLIQPSVGQRPTFRYGSQGINGKPCLEFSSSQKMYISSANLADWGFSSQGTVFCVMQRTSGGVAVPFSWQAGGVTNLAFYHPANDMLSYFSVGGSYIVGNIPYTSGPKIVSCKFGGGSSVVRQNGAEIITGAVSVSSFNASAQFSVGEGGGLYSEMKLGELIIYNRQLTNDEILQVEAYLTAKWTT